MAFEISVEGRRFVNWETASVTRTIDRNTGTFQFSSSSKTPAAYPVRAGNDVQIILNGTPVLTGKCDLVKSSYDDGVSQVIVAGRDSTADLIDSSIPDAAKSIKGPITMVALCERVIAALGANIPVTQTATGIDNFTANDVMLVDAGTNCMDYLTDFARTQQVYLIADGAGRLDIFRPTETLFGGAITFADKGKSNNVTKASGSIDHSQRFYKYSVRSQDNFGGDPEASGVDRGGEAIDDAIRTSRFLEVQGEESMNNSVSVNRAIEEMNLRLAQSTVYTATMAGLEREKGVLWNIGQLTTVTDDYNDFKGIFLIRSVTYSVDLKRGTKTQVTLAPPESYNVRVPTQADKRRAKLAPTLQNDSPPTERSIR